MITAVLAGQSQSEIARTYGVSQSWISQLYSRGSEAAFEPCTPLGFLEALDLGNEDGVMSTEKFAGKPTTRRHSPEEKAAAVRMVRALRAELGNQRRAARKPVVLSNCIT